MPFRRRREGGGFNSERICSGPKSNYGGQPKDELGFSIHQFTAKFPTTYQGIRKHLAMKLSNYHPHT